MGSEGDFVGTFVAFNGGGACRSKAVDDSETIEVEITKDVKVNVVRTMIADVRSKTEPKSDAKS